MITEEELIKKIEEKIDNQQKITVKYLKLINGENVIGFLVEETEEGYYVADVLESIKATGQFIPYDHFLEKTCFWFPFKNIMEDIEFDDRLSDLYFTAVQSFKDSVDKEESSVIETRDNKIITRH